MAQYFEAGMLHSEIHANAQEEARNPGFVNRSIRDFFMKLYMPNPDQQIAIANVLATGGRVAARLQQGLALWRQKKKDLLQQFLNGIVA